ncbi:Hint domain-containing protein [Paracoccus sp. R86501]|uniref:Hint domain-containing protein n=1 Tax=Paracoccus sp. R86501 TaxID=3101711 RepID=UPI003670E76B
MGYDFDVDPPFRFARGSLLLTPKGPVAVEDIKVGDLITAKANGYQPVRRISARQMATNPQFRPICSKTKALGHGKPSTDLIASPQHRILVTSRIATRMFGTTEVLVVAKQLLLIEGVDPHDCKEGVKYFHLLFE